MLEADLDELDLGSRRKPVQWVCTAPPLIEREKRNPTKRNNAQRRARTRGAVVSKPASGSGSLPSEDGMCIPVVDEANILALDSCTSAFSGEIQCVMSTSIVPESEEGNVEYKLRLKDPTPHRFQQLVTQLKFRLSEGNGECFYYVGVEDDGYLRGLRRADLEASLATLHAMAAEVHAAAVLLREIPGAHGGTCALLRVHRLCVDEASYTDLRIAVAGSVDSGKSTLVAVLSHGREGRPLLDDGRGAARMSVLRHKHEIVSGRTSSIAQMITGYDAEGRVLNYAGVAPPTPAEIASLAGKVLRFIDLGGHEKYLKTAMYGLTCMLPDHMLLCVCPLVGIGRVTREHLAAALALEMPLALVLTKVDIVAESIMDSALADIQELLAAATVGVVAASPGSTLPHTVLKAPLIISEAEAIHVAGRQRLDTDSAGRPRQTSIPVFAVSSVTGAGLSLLHTYLAALQPLAPDEAPWPSSEGGESLRDVPASVPLSRLSLSLSSCSSEGREADEEVGSCDGSCLGASPPSAMCEGPALEAAEERQPLHFQVDHMFEVRGVGSVVSGTLVAGVISVGQQLLLGPSPEGGFNAVTVSGIQRAQLPVKRVKSGQHATLAIQPYTGPAETLGADDIPPGHSPEAGTSRNPAAAPAQSPEGTPGQGPPGVGERVGESGQEPTCAGEHAGDSWQGAAGMGQRTGAKTLSWGAEGKIRRDAYARTSRPMAQEGYRIPQPPLQATIGFDIQEGGADFHDVYSARRSQSSPPLFVCLAPSSRKGAVLLDTAAQPRTAWEFEALLVFLSGHWPARGLLSRRYPPVMRVPGCSPGTSPDACLGSSPRAGRGHPRRQGGTYSPIIHCGSVRQAAHVIHMEELLADVASLGRVASCSLASAVAAGAALLGCGRARSPSGGRGPDADGEGRPADTGAGCATRVRFRFAQRPEWLRPGARLIVRDPEDGGAAGAGLVEEVFWSSETL